VIGVAQRRWIGAVLAGAICIASSAVLVRLSHSSASAAALFRCAFALPILAALDRIEQRRGVARPTRRARWIARASGVLLAADLIVWTHSIEAVGAGLATVLGNLQVLVVGLLAWWLFGERVHRSLLVALPIMFTGILLIGGLIGTRSYGANPALGVVFGASSSVLYAAFLLLFRHGMSIRQVGAGTRGSIVAPLYEATLGAAVSSGVLAIALEDFRLGPVWPALGWLAVLAITAQVAGWLLITASLPRLPAALTSALLLVQPVGAVGLGAVTFGERPSVEQLAGVMLILVGVLVAASGEARRKPAENLELAGQL
jgi:drug/metabolite transporter (DMT)-like permease